MVFEEQAGSLIAAFKLEFEITGFDVVILCSY